MSYWKRLSILYAANRLLSKARNLLIRPILTQQRYGNSCALLVCCQTKCDATVQARDDICPRHIFGISD